MRLACFFLVIALVTGSGCASAIGAHRVEHRNSRIQKDQELARRAQEIAGLRSELARKDDELKARDAEIEALKSKLRNFGVF